MNETKRLGEILIESNLLKPEHVETALALQKAATTYQTIGRFIVKQGFMTETDLQMALDRTGKRQRLEDILIKHNLVSKDDLALALEMAEQEQLPVTTVLKNLEFIDAVTASKALALQYDMAFMRLDGIRPLPALASIINQGYASSNRLVPLSKTSELLTLAMAQPLETKELMALETSIRLKIKPVIALESEILGAQNLLYSKSGKASASGAAPGLDPGFRDESDASQQLPEGDEETRQVTEKDSLLVKLVNKIIGDAHASRASDIHIEPYPGKDDIVVRFRIDGRCEDYLHLPHKYKYALPSRIKIMADLDIAEKRKPQDGKINFKTFGTLDVELRVATMPTAGGLEDVVIRLLHTSEPVPFENLGLSARNQQVFRDAIASPYGMVLVVGPTGSGKTTTLHSAIAQINNPKVKIWTAEDPVEITQKGLRQVQVNPKIGFTFAKALRSFLRLDPDIIMVGEMRDEETASIAIEASLTGHLVFSTLHTNSAPDTITRLLEMGIEPFSFSDALQLIMAQRLTRRVCEHCREKYHPEKEELDELDREFGGGLLAASGLARNDIILSKPVGCSNCQDSGYAGRLGIHELLVCTDEIKTLIKKREDTAAIRKCATAQGMLTLKQDGILKILQGLTDIHEIRRVCIK